MVNNKFLLAYIDLLGFSDYVKDNPDSGIFKSKLDGVFATVKGKLENFIIKHGSEIYQPVVEYAPKYFFSHLEHIMFSDSLIICLDVNKTIQNFKSPGMEFEDVERENRWIKVMTESVSRFFLQNIAMTVFMVICETHLLVRGGIARGGFYSSPFKDIKGEFLLSQALIDAVKLEEIARMPRIIISDEIVSDLKGSIWMDHSLIWTDIDGENILDIYHYPKCFTGISEVIESSFKGHSETSNKELFPDVISKKLITLNSEKDKKRDVWNKWFWFKEYHNKRMKEIDSRFIINI